MLFVESQATLARANLHRRRAHLVLSAMRRRAAALREAGDVEVVERRGARSFAQALRDERDVVCAAPNRAGVREHLERLGVRLVASNQFLTDPDAFAAWAQGRRRLGMEDFYREQRRRHGVLVDEHGEPEAGAGTSTPKTAARPGRA